MGLFTKKVEVKKTAVDVKRDAVIQNISQLLGDRITAMSDVYGKDVLCQWLTEIENKYFEVSQIGRAHV